MAQPTINVQAPLPSNMIPEMRNRVGWWAFIAGAPESEWNPPKKPKTNKDRRFGKGMRGFPEEEGLEGELESVEAESSLPTPHGTPPPPDQLLEGESATRREPTPFMLHLIDEVRIHLAPWPISVGIEIHSDRKWPFNSLNISFTGSIRVQNGQNLQKPTQGGCSPSSPGSATSYPQMI